MPISAAMASFGYGLGSMIEAGSSVDVAGNSLEGGENAMASTTERMSRAALMEELGMNNVQLGRYGMSFGGPGSAAALGTGGVAAAAATTAPIYTLPEVIIQGIETAGTLLQTVVTAGTVGGAIFVGGLFLPHPAGSVQNHERFLEQNLARDREMLAKQSRRSGKEKASDIPDWVKGKKPLPGEKPTETAERLLDEKYGPDNWPDGGGSEYSKINKWFQRGFGRR